MGRFTRFLFWAGVVVAIAAVPTTMAALGKSALGIFVDFCKGVVTVLASLVSEGDSATNLGTALLALLTQAR